MIMMIFMIIYDKIYYDLFLVFWLIFEVWNLN